MSKRTFNDRDRLAAIKAIEEIRSRGVCLADALLSARLHIDNSTYRKWRQRFLSTHIPHEDRMRIRDRYETDLAHCEAFVGGLLWGGASPKAARYAVERLGKIVGLDATLLRHALENALAKSKGGAV